MTRRSPSLLAVLAALGLLFAAACNSSGASPTASGTGAGPGLAPIELAGTSWTLLEIDGTPLSVADKVTLEFRADGSAGGTSGCNTYNGTYTVDGAGITFGPLLSTKMACEQMLMTLETTYLTGLQGATSFGVDGTGNLVLGGAATLAFARA